MNLMNVLSKLTHFFSELIMENYQINYSVPTKLKTIFKISVLWISCCIFMLSKEVPFPNHLENLELSGQLLGIL